MTDQPPEPPRPAATWADIGLLLSQRLLPDARGWCAMALFGLTVGILQMIHDKPELLSNASFMQLATTIAGAGGFGMWVAFNFTTSSGTAKANDRADKANARADAANAGTTTITAPPPAEVTVTTPAE